MSMHGYDVNVSIQPKYRYEKTRRDVIQAMKSMQELTPWQRGQLAKELLESKAVTYI